VVGNHVQPSTPVALPLEPGLVEGVVLPPAPDQPLDPGRGRALRVGEQVALRVGARDAGGSRKSNKNCLTLAWRDGFRAAARGR
jgi:hypothetical protein